MPLLYKRRFGRDDPEGITAVGGKSDWQSPSNANSIIHLSVETCSKFEVYTSSEMIRRIIWERVRIKYSEYCRAVE